MKIRNDNTFARAGFALILVMITVLALTTLVATFAISMNTEVRLARNADCDEELEWMGRSGIEFARYSMANKCPEQQNMDALNQFWATQDIATCPCSNGVSPFTLQEVYRGDGIFSDFKIVDMERKWDINLAANPRAPELPVLQKALTLVGVTDAAQASTIEESMLDWCSPNGTARFNGAKDEYYTRLNPPYYCKNGPIDDLSELLLIKGITPEIYWGSNATNHPVSAYQQHGGGALERPTTGRAGLFGNKDEPAYPHGLQELFAPLGGRLNVNTASALTLQLLPGIDEELADRIVQQRDEAPFSSIPQFLGALGTTPTGAAPIGSLVDVRSYVFDVQVRAEVSGYTNYFHGIISRSSRDPKDLRCVKFYWQTPGTP